MGFQNIAYEKFIESRGKSHGNLEPQARRFQRLLAFIPERKRLCAMIDGPIEYSEEQKMSLVEDLITIASKNLEDLYRPGEEPVDGCCPVISCAFPNLRVRILTVHSGPTSSHFTVAHFKSEGTYTFAA